MISYVPYLPIGGITLSPSLILINRKFRNDKALLAHELCHAQQMIVTGTLKFWILYLFSRQFRMKSEIEAYKVSIKTGRSMYLCAYNLADMYYLGIDYNQAVNYLK